MPAACSRRRPAPAPAERYQLLRFVEAGERAKTAYERGALAEAHQLYAAALQQAAPLAHRADVQEVTLTLRRRLEETRPVAAPRRSASSSSAPPPPSNELEAAVRDLVVAPGASGVRWDDVVGLDRAKQALWEAVVLPALNPELFTGLRAPPRGILLYGPPGNGKTYLAKAAAAECKATFFSVSASSLTSKWHGESEKLVRALFDVARSRAPSVVFLDEADSVLSARSASDTEAARRLKTEFLVRIEGVVDGDHTTAGPVRQVVVLAATNRPFDLDEAVLRRFAVQVHIPLPDEAARLQLLRSALRQQRHALSEGDFAELARRTARFSSSDIRNVCREASMCALRELPSAQVARLRADQLRPVSMQDFVHALQASGPSVSEAAAEELETWARRRGGGG